MSRLRSSNEWRLSVKLLDICVSFRGFRCKVRFWKWGRVGTFRTASLASFTTGNFHWLKGHRECTRSWMSLVVVSIAVDLIRAALSRFHEQERLTGLAALTQCSTTATQTSATTWSFSDSGGPLIYECFRISFRCWDCSGRRDSVTIMDKLRPFFNETPRPLFKLLPFIFKNIEFFKRYLQITWICGKASQTTWN